MPDYLRPKDLRVPVLGLVLASALALLASVGVGSAVADSRQSIEVFARILDLGPARLANEEIDRVLAGEALRPESIAGDRARGQVEGAEFVRVWIESSMIGDLEPVPAPSDRWAVESVEYVEYVDSVRDDGYLRMVWVEYIAN